MMNDYKLGYSQQVIQTSEQGDKLALKSNVRFQSDETSRNIIEVKPDQLKQSLHGVGASFTEASAFVLAHLESAQCTEVMKKVFSEEGANFPIAYAEYLIKYLEAYKAEGVDIWGLTPVNEPGGNNGNWESMHFTPETQNSFIKNHLGPKLKASEHSDINLMIFDHNTGDLESWADEIIADPETSQYVYGSAVHWYESTNKVLEEVFDKVHEKYPDYPIIHTEGCIDDLGNDAPPGVLDPVFGGMRMQLIGGTVLSGIVLSWRTIPFMRQCIVMHGTLLLE